MTGREHATTRVELARAEIARRRAIARGAVTVVDAMYQLLDEAWAVRLAMRLLTSQRRAEHILANDPAHVLRVLAAADAALDRHARTHTCQARWLDDTEAAAGSPGRYIWPHLLCAEAQAVLDLYTPQEAP
jgi:hypothetical protein